MEELDIATVVKRSIRGVLALVSRSIVIQGISLLTALLLFGLLDESDIGIFAVVSASLAFLTYFSDIGLAAALIQKKESLTTDDLRTTFTIQQILVVLLVLIAFLLSGFLGAMYHLNSEGILLFQALVVAFFLASLKTIPSIILERNLQFERLVLPQVFETLAFSGVVLYCAFHGYGIMSYTYAVLARGIVGLIAIYCIAPWRIGFTFSKSVARKLLSFGVPFQANSILALLKDDLLTLYLGIVLPFAQVGYIGFAQKLAFTPLRLVMDNIIRITFPTFSRLAHEPTSLGKAIEKSLFVTLALILPALTGVVILAPYLIEYVPKYQKWEPALVALTFFAINAAFSSLSTPLTNALNAIGKVKVTLYLMVFWTVLTWGITPLAIMQFGFNGVAYTSALVGTTAVIVVAVVRRYIQFRLGNIIWVPLLATAIMGIVLFFISAIVITNIPMLFVAIGIGTVVYFGTLFALGKQHIIEDVRMIALNLRK
ncbi:MAG: oligosaccharide flippase family protein [Patescibacteria group bacterium]